MITNPPSVGLDAIQAAVKASPEAPKGHRIVGYRIALTSAPLTFDIHVLARTPGKKGVTYTLHVFQSTLRDVGEYVYQYEAAHVPTAQTLFPSLAALREHRLLQTNGEDTTHA